LVSEGLLPWVKHSDIQPDVFGSDHCPVYLELHESIVDPITGQTLHLRDLMNQGSRPPLPPHLEALKDESRDVPEPPPFATKWWDEFSGKQRSLMSFFGKKAPTSEGGSQSVKPEPRNRERSSSANASRSTRALSPVPTRIEIEDGLLPPIDMPVSLGAMPLTIDDEDEEDDDDLVLSGNGLDQAPIEVGSSPIEASPVYKRKRESPKVSSATGSSQPGKSIKGKSKEKEKEPSGQTKLSAFFRQPTVSPSTSTASTKGKKKIKEISPSARPAKHARTVSHSSTGLGNGDEPIEIDDDQTQIEMDDEALAMSMAREEEEMMGSSGESKPVTEDAKKSWGSIFAKKVPPKCIVHEVPCKSFGESSG
jgi:AP endonuclease-2